MKNFEELDIWRQGCQFAVDIYQVTEEGPFSKDKQIGSFIRKLKGGRVTEPADYSE